MSVEPIWQAIQSLKRLLDLIPDTLSGATRLSQCLTLMRDEAEKDQFPDAVPDAPSRDTLRPISYPLQEANQIIEQAKPLILGLIDSVEIENKFRTRLKRELVKKTAFLETDDRGTIGAFLAPSGLTKEKERNNSKLDALASFLHALRQQPFAAVRYAVQLLKSVAIPPDLLSVNCVKLTVTFRGREYALSEQSCYFVSMLITANGGKVSTGELQRKLKDKGLEEKSQIRSDRLTAKLPEELRNAILTDPRGSHLDVDLLLSYA